MPRTIDTLTARILPDSRIVTVKGRDAWALRNLVSAGPVGCTPIDQPGPRWAHYVFKLRRSGLIIETIEEKHGGPYAGTHARYVLRTQVEVVDESGRAAA
ncbi:winged helix domain-containing protein [Rhizobium sp. CC-YZS058]|uniref:winged helix domain-containing protein n=1 Tax=Rhizobium sp. CC-YZS058 TaxID=3042153 RepID=UPI002B0549F1|nr:hypothetical protein [Rhizobium sp. CC-YZS058]MEA3533222.1 hypothetical protein [Rhizobium sp. CC-YZS058]